MANANNVFVEEKALTLNAAIFQDGNALPAGTFVFLPDAETSTFSYHEEYDGPPLDPVNLDYQRRKLRTFENHQAPCVPQCFLDHLPGNFALQILNETDARIGKHLGRNKEAELLYHLGARATGGMLLSSHQFPVETPIQGEVALNLFYNKLAALPAGRNLQGMTGESALNKSATNEPPSHQERTALSTHGGVRPKVTTVINHPEGQENSEPWQVIAKFNLVTDGFDHMSRVEKSTLELARACGIDSVPAMVHPLGEHAECCAVRRYDRDEHGNGTYAISLYAMTASGTQNSNSGDYREYMRVIREISANPKQDVEEMLRRLIFNVRINNHDDHGRQFEMLLMPEGWRLAPAYDLIPNPVPVPHGSLINGRAFFSHGLKLDNVGIDDLLDGLGIRSVVPIIRAIEIRNRLDEAVRGWKEIFDRNVVTGNDVSLFRDALYLSMRQS